MTGTRAAPTTPAAPEETKMIRTAVARSLALAVLSSFALPAVAILAPVAYAYDEQARYFEREEIEQLTAPIALYPDPLLAQILAASAYPDEIAMALRHVERSGDADIERQDWDASVRAVARYREVLDFLARDLEWTQALGIANVNQPDDIADAIQRWRLQAYDLGSLRTNSQQIVYVDSGYVRIVPAQQDYVYVPRYDPEVIYVTRYVAGTAPFLFFGPRYVYGAWFDKDWDWGRRRIYYCNRDYWRNGRPVFHPQFDRVHVDRNRHWQPDRVRFKPPEKPALPPRFVQTKIPSPPPEVKAGTPRNTHPPQANQPIVRRGPGDEKNAAPPTGGRGKQAEQPMHKRFSTGKQGQPPASAPAKAPAAAPAPAKATPPAEQPKPQPQAQQPQQKQQQRSREDELLQQQRGPRR
jgi:hypothetical protein